MLQTEHARDVYPLLASAVQAKLFGSRGLCHPATSWRRVAEANGRARASLASQPAALTLTCCRLSLEC